MARPLVHRKLLANLRDFFPQTVTIQVETTSRDSVGGVISAWANLAGHVGIPAAIYGIGGSEVYQADRTVVTDRFRLVLGGHYPAIVPGLRAIAGSRSFNIRDVDHDSQLLTSELVADMIDAGLATDIIFDDGLVVSEELEWTFPVIESRADFAIVGYSETGEDFALVGQALVGTQEAM
jgi:head-tail adaptor